MDMILETNLKKMAAIYVKQMHMFVDGNDWVKDFLENQKIKKFLVEVAKQECSEDMLEYIVGWLVRKVPINHIKLILSKQLNDERMFKLDLILDKSNKLNSTSLTKPQLGLLLYPNIEGLHMGFIHKCFLEGDSAKEVKRYILEGANIRQWAEIRVGYKAGLTDEQVAIYAKKEYSSGTMAIIRGAISKGLSKEQLNLMLDSSLTSEQVNEIYKGLKTLSIEKVKLFANPKFTAKQMQEIRLGFLNELSIECIELYASEKYNDLQMKVIRNALKYIGKEKVELFLNPEYTADKMKNIYSMLRMGYTEDVLKPYSNLSDENIKLVFALVCKKFNQDTINKILSYNLNPAQKKCIIEGCEKDFSEKQILLYAKPEFSCFEMEEIIEALKHLPVSKVKRIANPKLNKWQMREITTAFCMGIKVKHVKLYAKEEFDNCQMETITNCLKKHKEKFVPYINSQYSVKLLKVIEKALTNNFTESEINEIIQADQNGMFASDAFDEIKKRKLGKYDKDHTYLIQQSLLKFAQEEK